MKGVNNMGYRIKELRVAAKITQAQLADKSGVSRSIINGLETGRTTTTTTETLCKIAEALGCAVGDIFFAERV